MKKKSIKSALKNSIAQEVQHFDQRFDKAEKLFPGLPKEPHVEQNEKGKAQKEVDPRERVVRDTFSMPSSDYDLIAAVKTRCLRLGLDTTRSEIVRAGIKHLSEVSENDLLEILRKVAKLKPGRAKEHN